MVLKPVSTNVAHIFQPNAQIILPKFSSSQKLTHWVKHFGKQIILK